MNVARWICLFIQAPAWLPVRGTSSLCINWATQMEICRFPERVFQHPRSQEQLRTQLSGGGKRNTTPTHSFHFPLPHYKQMSPHLFSFFNHVLKVLYLFLTPPAVKSGHCQEADKQRRYRGANKKTLKRAGNQKSSRGYWSETKHCFLFYERQQQPVARPSRRSLWLKPPWIVMLRRVLTGRIRAAAWRLPGGNREPNGCLKHLWQSSDIEGINIGEAK